MLRLTHDIQTVALTVVVLKEEGSSNGSDLAFGNDHDSIGEGVSLDHEMAGQDNCPLFLDPLDERPD